MVLKDAFDLSLEEIAEALSTTTEARFMQGDLPNAPRVELDGDRVAHLWNYFFNPDFIAEVPGLPWRSNGYRWSATACPGAPTGLALRPPVASLTRPRRPRAKTLHQEDEIMSLTLHFHPLSSFCWKALIGLYELDIPFEKHVVDLSNETARADFVRLWPIGKFPVLRDHTQGRTVPESTIILEYIDRLRPEGPRLIPAAPDRALECRLRDRFYDAYIHLPMQKIVGDKLRPEDERDPFGVEQARAQMETAYAVADDQLRVGPWAMGDHFTLADCAALPALFYGDKVAPFAKRWSNVNAYFDRLKGRPSVARVLAEAAPYLKMFPG